MMAPPALIICEAVHVHDGDGPLWCKGGRKIRVAGIQAPDWEDAPPCRQHRPGYVCDDVKAAARQRIVAKLVLGKTLTCRKVDKNRARVVAVCTLPDRSDLACSIVTLGAAEWWPMYVRRYGLEMCDNDSNVEGRGVGGLPT